MEKHKLVQDFEQHVDFAIASKELRNVEVMSGVLMELFEDAAERNPAKASEIMDMFKGKMDVNNYLSESQAKKMVSELRGGKDGEKGAKWGNPQVVFDMAKRHELPMEAREMYNKHAYYFMVNTIALDHEEYIKGNIKEDHEFYLHAHELAYDRLTDFDHPHVIEDYM